MPTLARATKGRLLKDPPSSFPLYFRKRQPRVVTADVWAYLRHAAAQRLPKREENQAIAFIEQAFEFYEAAENPRIGSRPLLYYYTFLNLAKATLLIKRVNLPLAPRHGISDPRTNVKKRLRLEGQEIRVEACAHNHQELFPEFVKVLGGDASRPRELKVLSLLQQLPGIHRTFCRVTGKEPSFLPVRGFQLLRAKGKVFCRLVLNQTDADVRKTIDIIRNRRAFQGCFHQVRAPAECSNEQVWFESQLTAGAQSITNSALRRLAKSVNEVGIWSILTAQGYLYYLCTIPPRDALPPLASIYATMFYFGSITRYKPYDFDRIVSREHSWLVSEFLKTQPSQFLYGLASHIAGVDVVRPFASLT